jgi:hypothetical protein
MISCSSRWQGLESFDPGSVPEAIMAVTNFLPYWKVLLTVDERDYLWKLSETTVLTSDDPKSSNVMGLLKNMVVNEIQKGLQKDHHNVSVQCRTT